MKVRILKQTVACGRKVKVGDIVDVPNDFLVKIGKAEPYTPPKKDRMVKDADNKR